LFTAKVDIIAIQIKTTHWSSSDRRRKPKKPLSIPSELLKTTRLTRTKALPINLI
jgi:hypothetical protein